MKSFFNSIKSAVSSLTRTPEQTATELREALKKSGQKFDENQGSFGLTIPYSKKFAYSVDIRLTPQKNTVAGQISMSATAPVGEQLKTAELPAGFMMEPDKNPFTISFEVPVSDIINSVPEAIDRFSGIAKDAIKKSGALRVPADLKSLSMAIEGMPLEILPVRLNRQFLKVAKSDSIPANWYIYTIIRKDNILLRLSVKEDLEANFDKEGLEASHTYPITTVTKQISLENIADVKELREDIERFMKKAANVLAKFAEQKNFKPDMLDVAVFDCGLMAEGLKHNKYFEKIDDDGDVKLSIPASDNFSHNRFAWVYISPDRITIEVGVNNFSVPENAIETIQKLEKDNPQIKFKLKDDRTLRIKAYVDPEQFTATELPEKSFDKIDSQLQKLLEFWGVIMQAVGVRYKKSQQFDLDAVRQRIKKAPSFKEMDKDGDIKLNIEGSSSFRPDRFVWVIMKPETIKLDGGISNFAKLAKKTDLEQIIKNFNDKGTGFTAYKSDNTVRLKKVFSVEGYPHENPTSKALGDVENAITKISDALTVLAQLAGIKTQYYIPTYSDWEKLFSNNSAVSKVSNSGNEYKVEIKPTVLSNGSNVQSVLTLIKKDSELILKLRNWMHGDCTNYQKTSVNEAVKRELGRSVSIENESVNATVSFSEPYSELDSQSQFYELMYKALKALMEGESLAVKFAQEDIDRKIKEQQEAKKREEEERRRREREERAEYERKLDAGFNYTLRPGGTVRALQEGFTEDYPYLRIGVYMVKTGQQADRTGGTIQSFSSDTQFGTIRSFKGECKVRIEGRSTPESLEKEFRRISGLVIKICYNDEHDQRYYIGNDSNWYKMHIYDLNKKFRELGYKKADIS